jgi:hypothetical protein
MSSFECRASDASGVAEVPNARTAEPPNAFRSQAFIIRHSVFDIRHFPMG